MDIDKLKSVVKGNISAGELSLAASLLESDAINQLSQSFLPNGHLVIRDVTPERVVEPADEESITVVGTGNAVPFGDMRVEARFSVRDGGAALHVTATGQDGWTFDKSFPPLSGTLFARLAFDPSPVLHLASYQVSDAIPPGMSFDGMLQMTSALGGYGFLLGPGSKKLSGAVQVEHATPKMALGGPLNPDVTLGFFRLPAVTFEVLSVPVYNSADQAYHAETFMRFGTSIAFEVQDKAAGRPKTYHLPLSAEVHDQQTTILFIANLTEAVDAAIKELSNLFDGLGLDHLLPSSDFSIEDAVRLTDLVVQVNPSAANKVTFVTAGAQTTKSWTLVRDQNLGKAFTLDAVKFNFRLDDPAGARLLSASVLGDMTLGEGGELEFNASSDLTFAGGLKQGKVLKLKELVEAFGGGTNSDFPDIEVRELDILMQPKSGAYAVGAEADGELTVTLSDFDFGVEEVSFHVNHPAGGATEARVSGRFLIAGVDVEVAVNHPAAGGLELEGQTGDDEEINFTDLITELFGLFGLDLPPNLPEIALKNLYVYYNTQTKAFACRGQNKVASQIQLGANPHEVDTYLDLRVNTDPQTGQTVYAGFLRGALTLGTAVFQLEWDFGAASVVKGVWDGKGGALGFNDLAGSHGIDNTLQPPGSLDLTLSRASFEFDLTQSRFVLSADSATYGDAFFIASNANQTWDFAFGVVLDVAAIPGFPDLGALSIKESSLILSTVRDDNFRVPSLPSVPPPPNVTPPAAAPRRAFPAISANTMRLRPGVTVAAVLDVDQSAGGSPVVANLKQVVGKPEIVVQAVIADPVSQSSFIGYLSGSLTISGAGGQKIVLSNVYVQLQLAPPVVLVAGSVLIPVDQVTVDASGAMVISAEEMQAIFDVRAEADGQPAALPFPFGLLGVRLDELAVAVGMIFEPPGVDMGLEGKFNIIGQPPGANQFTLILELEEEIPNPLYLSAYIQSLSVSDMITAVTGEAVSDIPDLIKQIQAQELSVYWSETAGLVLPDRTLSRAGFGFNGFITVGSFSAHARLDVSAITGVSGDAEMSPINWHDVLLVKGAGKGVTILQELVGGEWQGVRKAQLQPAAGGAPRPQTREFQIIEPGGAVIAFNSKTSPFIDVSAQVSLFNLANVDVEIVVAASGFTFKLDGQIGSFVKFAFDCSLDKSGFTSHAEFDLDIAGDIGPVVILGVDLGTIKLDVSFAAVLDLTINSSGFTLKVAGKFWFDDFHLTMPDLTIHTDFKSLEELPGRIVRQIGEFAEDIFQDVFNEARKLLEDAEAEAKKIADAVAGEAQQIADDAAREAERIAQAAETVYQNVAAGVAEAEAEAQKLEKEAAQILSDAEAEVKQIGEAVEQEAKKLEADAAKLLSDAEAEVQEIERAVAQEVKQLEAQAKQLFDEAAAEVGRIGRAAEQEAEAVLNEARGAADAILDTARDAARKMEDEAKKILDEIEEEAKKAVHWVEKETESAWHAIKKY